MWTILGVLAALIPVISALYFIRKIIKAIKAPANDFSFGRKDILATGLFVKNKKIPQAEGMLTHFNSDDFTQAVDHIAISCNEKQLRKFYELSNGSPLSSLLLGAWHLHKAWMIRGHKLGTDLKDKQVNGYLEQLNLAAPMLQNAATENRLSAEANSRMIRLEMGLGNIDAAEQHFKTAIKADPGHLWAYIHYAECIQPKWGGSIEQVQNLLKTLPSDYLIRSIIRLKLMYDNYSSDIDYFGLDDMEEQWDSFLSESIKAFDAEISSNPPESIQRFVLYGYMYALSPSVDKSLTKKYKKLVGANFTLYPFGYLN